MIIFFLDPDSAHARRATAISFQELLRTIRRAVVDDQHLVKRVILAFEHGEQLPEIIQLIPGTNDDTDSLFRVALFAYAAFIENQPREYDHYKKKLDRYKEKQYE